MDRVTALTPEYNVDLEPVAAPIQRNGSHRAHAPLAAYEVHAGFDSARALQREWDHLVEELDGDAFSTFTWCEVWWRHFGAGRTLEIHTARMAGALVGVLPLFRETIRFGPFSVVCVKIVGTDRSNTTCRPIIRPEYAGWVMREAVNALSARGRWDVLFFGEMPGYFDVKPIAATLRKAAPDRRVILDERYHPQMIFDLPGDYESWLAALPRKERRNVRHDERELSTADYQCHQPSEAVELSHAFDSLIGLHEEQWSQRGWRGHFGDFPGVERFHRDVAEEMQRHGRTMLVTISVDKQPVAAEYCIQFGRRVHWITGGRAPGIASRVGVCAIIKEALRRGANQVDALNGFYDYKRRLGARAISLQTLTVETTQGSRRATLAAVRLGVWLTFQLYCRAWYWHLAPWLRRKMPRVRSGPLKWALDPKFLRSRFLVQCGRRNQGESASQEDVD